MRYTLDEFLALPADDQAEYWSDLQYFVDHEGHETFCSVAIEANTDTSIGSGRIPQAGVRCDCNARHL